MMLCLRSIRRGLCIASKSTSHCPDNCQAPPHMINSYGGLIIVHIILLSLTLIIVFSQEGAKCVWTLEDHPKVCTGWSHWMWGPFGHDGHMSIWRSLKGVSPLIQAVSHYKESMQRKNAGESVGHVKWHVHLIWCGTCVNARSQADNTVKA